MIEKKQRFVMITTDKKGVFAGLLESYDHQTQRAVLTECRMCVYWPAENRGVAGLAADGPARGAKITPAMPRSEIGGVTMIADCTDESVEKWRSEPWG